MDKFEFEQFMFTVGIFIVGYFITLIILASRIVWHHYPVNADERKIVLEHQSNCGVAD